MSRNPFKVPTADRTIDDWRNIARFMERRDHANRKLLQSMQRRMTANAQEVKAHHENMPHTGDDRNWE